MKKIGVILLVALLVGKVYSGPMKYESEKFKDLEKMAKVLVEENLKSIKKLGINKVVIIECVGEFLTSKEIEASAFEKRHSNFTTGTKSTIELGKEYYVYAADKVYDLIKKIFEENGIIVAEKEDLIANEIYNSYDLKDEKKGGGYTGGVMKQSVTTNTKKVSTSGLGMLPGGLGLISFIQKMPAIANDLGAQGALQIYFYVDKGKNGSPVLTSFNIVLHGGMNSVTAGFKRKEKTTHYFKQTNIKAITLKSPIASPVDVRGAEKGSIDMEKYDSALMEILNSVSEIYSFCIKKAVSK